MSPVKTLNPVPWRSFLIYVDWKVSHVRSRRADVNLQINCRTLFVSPLLSVSMQDCGKLLPTCEAQNNPHQRGRAGKRWMKKRKIVERQEEYLQRSTLWRFKGENPKPGGTEEILSQCLAREGEGAKRDANKQLLKHRLTRA